MASFLSAPHFHDEEKAYEYVEARLWADGPVCPHCGGLDRIGKLKGKTTRVGLYKCYDCRKPFTVKIGTIFEDSKVKMHIWLQAMFLIAGSKKGISSNQLHRILGVTLKTAWFMSHRIREAMRSGGLAPFGQGGGMVEVDETYYGKKPGVPVSRGRPNQHTVLSLVDRETGGARSFVIKHRRASEIAPVLEANIAREAHLMTDEARVYKHLGWNFAEHSAVNHRKDEYVRRDNPVIHTNTIEGFRHLLRKRRGK